jgi:hypothetical protein
MPCKPRPKAVSKPVTLKEVRHKIWQLGKPEDFKKCLRKVLGDAVPQEVLELYFYAFDTRNRELYDFLKNNVEHAGDDGRVNLSVSVREPVAIPAEDAIIEEATDGVKC